MSNTALPTIASAAAPESEAKIAELLDAYFTERWANYEAEEGSEAKEAAEGHMATAAARLMSVPLSTPAAVLARLSGVLGEDPGGLLFAGLTWERNDDAFELVKLVETTAADLETVCAGGAVVAVIEKH